MVDPPKGPRPFRAMLDLATFRVVESLGRASKTFREESFRIIPFRVRLNREFNLRWASVNFRYIILAVTSHPQFKTGKNKITGGETRWEINVPRCSRQSAGRKVPKRKVIARRFIYAISSWPVFDVSERFSTPSALTSYGRTLLPLFPPRRPWPL